MFSFCAADGKTTCEPGCAESIFGVGVLPRNALLDAPTRSSSANARRERHPHTPVAVRLQCYRRGGAAGLSPGGAGGVWGGPPGGAVFPPAGGPGFHPFAAPVPLGWGAGG